MSSFEKRSNTYTKEAIKKRKPDVSNNNEKFQPNNSKF